MRIIADCCANHNGNEEILEQMIHIADEKGIDILKFQLFTADKLNSNWLKQYEYYKKHEMTKKMFEKAIMLCKSKEIIPLVTLFDPEKESWLHDLDVVNVKVGSAEAHHKEWVLGLAERFKTVFVSCGMIRDKLIREYRKVPNIKLFYCISKYPLETSEIDFETMKHFDGFSDHTQNIKASMAAIESEMDYIERHYTLGKFLPGNDHKISSTPDEFQQLVNHRDYIEKKKKFQTRWRF